MTPLCPGPDPSAVLLVFRSPGGQTGQGGSDFLIDQRIGVSAAKPPTVILTNVNEGVSDTDWDAVQ